MADEGEQPSDEGHTDSPNDGVTLVDLRTSEGQRRASPRNAVVAALVAFVLAVFALAVLLVGPGQEELADLDQPGPRGPSIVAIGSDGDLWELSSDSFDVVRTIWSPPAGQPTSSADRTVSASPDGEAVYFTVTQEGPGAGAAIWRSSPVGGEPGAVAEGTMPAAGSAGRLAYADPQGRIVVRQADGTTSAPTPWRTAGPIVRWSPDERALLFNRSTAAVGSELVVASPETGSATPVLQSTAPAPGGVVADFLDDSHVVVAGAGAPTLVETFALGTGTETVESTVPAVDAPRPLFRLDPESADRIVDLAVERDTAQVLVVSELVGGGGSTRTTLWSWSADAGLRRIGDGYRAATWGRPGPASESPSTTVTRPPDTTIPAGGCSAARYEGAPIEPQEGLPEAIQRTRLELVAAATSCDWQRLLELRMPDPGWYLDSGYRIGAPQYELNLEHNREDLERLRSEEDAGRQPLARLVEALRGSYFCKDAICLWLVGPSVPGGSTADSQYYESRSIEVGVGTHGSWNLFWPLDDGTLPSNIFDCVPDWTALDRSFDCGFVGPPPTQNGRWPDDWPKLFWGGRWDEP